MMKLFIWAAAMKNWSINQSAEAVGSNQKQRHHQMPGSWQKITKPSVSSGTEICNLFFLYIAYLNGVIRN